MFLTDGLKFRFIDVGMLDFTILWATWQLRGCKEQVSSVIEGQNVYAVLNLWITFFRRFDPKLRTNLDGENSSAQNLPNPLPQPHSIRPLQPVPQHRTMHLRQDIPTHVDHIARMHPQQQPVERRMVRGSKLRNSPYTLTEKTDSSIESPTA